MPPVRKSDSNPAKPTKKVYSKLKFKMSPGMTGFLVMGNRSKEKRSLSEAVQLLTDFMESTSIYTDSAVPEKNSTVDQDLEDELKSLREKNHKNSVFLSTTLEVPCIGFIQIKSGISHPSLFIDDFYEYFTQSKTISRNVNRLLPVDKICYANIKDIEGSLQQLVENYMKKIVNEAKTCNETMLTFSVVYRQRHNGNLKREEIVSSAASIIAKSYPELSVDLKAADIVVIIEVIASVCCLAITKNFFRYSKFNLMQIRQN